MIEYPKHLGVAEVARQLCIPKKQARLKMQGVQMSEALLAQWIRDKHPPPEPDDCPLDHRACIACNDSQVVQTIRRAAGNVLRASWAPCQICANKHAQAEAIAARVDREVRAINAALMREAESGGWRQETKRPKLAPGRWSW